MAKDLHDNVSRVKRFNAIGTTLFVGLRAADVLLQHALLQRGWAKNLIEFAGGNSLNSGIVLNPATSQIHPYYGIVTFMAFGSSFKQIYTALGMSEQDMPPSSAVIIALFNTIFNSLNTCLSVWTATSALSSATTLSELLGSPAVATGLAFYLIGILTEAASETQRMIFKKNPANKGKPYAGGLFSLARHINYGGYTIWCTAYALTCGGWTVAIPVFTFFFYDFATRGVPVLDKYLSERVSPYLSLRKTSTHYSPYLLSMVIRGRLSKPTSLIV